MATRVLDNIPDHIKLPENLQLKQSSIDNDCLGVFSIKQVSEGTEFGPFVGKIVPSEARKNIDRRYSWEVFDLDTMTLTHILDATYPKDGNWMRYVNSARYFEEQNIVSTQVGQEVFYKAMKTIGAGEELLTWYKKKRGRKRKSTADPIDPEIKQEPPDVEDSAKPKQVTSPNPKKAKVGRPKATDSPKQKKLKVEVVPLPAIATEKPKRIRKPKIIPDSYEGPFLVPKKSRPVNDDQFEPLKPGQLRRRRKKAAPETAAKSSVESSAEKELGKADESSVEKTSNAANNGVKVKEEELESENQSTQNKTRSSPVENESSTYEDIINEVAKGKRRRKKSKEKIETEVNDKEKDENSPNKDNTASQPVSATNTLIEINNSVIWVYPERGQEYVFNLEKHMITQGPNGCVYTCDICTGIYKNKFSLKRHYLRNHINYRYLSKADIINCLINLQQVLETEGESGMVNVKTEPDETHCDTLDSSDGTNCASGRDSGLTHDGISSDEYNNAIIENVNENGEMVNGYLNNSEKAETAIEDPASAPSNILPAVEHGVENSEYGRSENSITQSAEKESKDLKTKIIAEKEGQNSELCNEDMKNFEIVDKQIKETGDTNTYLARKPETETTTSSENDKRTNGFVNDDSKLLQTRVKPEQQQGLYRCYTCRQIFDTLQQIKCHTALGHPEEINTKMQYSCDKCHMRFYFKHNLVRHSASHEVKLERKRRKPKSTVKQEIKDEIKEEPASPASPVSTLPPVFPDDGIPRNHQCAICHQRFDSLDLLYKHQAIHSDDLSKKRCPCQYCGKDFLSVTNMKKHVRFHLGYRITCRYCPEVFSNVGALRKHIRVSHPEIYKAKQLDKISQYGALRRKPDRKSCDTRDENCDSQESDKVEKTGKGLRRKRSIDKLTETEGVSSENKENSEIEQEKYHFEHGISFTADEIDDGGSRFKFSCTVCKKRFSNYVNMCRHRRKAHGNETRPRPEVPKPLPVTRLNPKKPKPLYSETPEEVALFYAGVSHNIATNLNEYIDGKVDSLENFKDYIKIEDYTPVSNETVKDVNPIDLTWEMYNFPPNYKPGKTISFTEIRQEFDIHSDFDSHCKSFDSQSDTVNLVEEESETGGARVRIQGSKILKTGDLNETTNCSNLCSRHSEEDLKQRTSENTEENKDKVNAPEKLKKTNNTCDFRLSASSENSDNSKMDLSDGKVLSILRRKLHKSREECASPFKHIENGEYANFDDLLIGDIDSPIIPRSQSVSSGISFTRKDLLKTSYINKSENMLDSLGNGNDEKSEDKNDVGPAFSPQTLSFLCENLLGLKRKETVIVSQNPSSGSSSLSSLDSHSSINEQGHNGSLFTTLSLAANQKEDERFQSTNQIFRDIKADYSEAPNHSLENYHDIAFGKNGQVASVCAICKKHFRDFDGLLRHHRKKHPASICQFIEVEQGNEIDALHFSEPSTVGALAVTDPGLDSVSDREVFTCTGCGSVFKTLAKLHIHIVSCTPIYSATGDIKTEKGSKTPIKKKIQNKVKNILNGGNSFKYKIQDLDTEKDENVQEGIKTQNGVETKTKSKVFSGFTGFRTILPKPPMTQLPIHMLDSTVKPRRKKSQELRGYNPQNHVRRRELTDLVDCHQCEACGLKFKTIILLERHVPNCSRKEKFKELCPMKCPIMDQSLEKLKHVCHYCHKHFTYLKSLVNHLHDFCAAKKQKVDSNTITDEDRVKENEIITKFKKFEEEKVGTVKVVENGARKKGWQKGVKRRPKRKGHSWTSIKRKKSGNGDINGEDIDTNAVDNGLVDKSSSSDEYEESDADYDLEKGNIPLKDEASTVKDNSDNIENEFSAFDFNDKAAIITIAPLEDPDVMENDSNSLHAPHSSEIADDIDEVDSGNDVFSNHKDSLLHLQQEDNNEKVIVINALSAPVITEQAKIIQHSENIIKMETNTSRVGHMSEEGELMVNNVFSDLSNVEEVKANETGNIMKHSIAQDEKPSCDYKTANVLRPVHLDQEESDPLELEATLPTRERTKSFLFQCMGSQVKTSEETTSSTADTHEVKERRFDSGWKKFRKSMKKKLGRSKGKYEVNKDTKDGTSSKVKENRLFKSFRKTQPKSLEKLFQENSTSNSHSGFEPANEKAQLEGNDALNIGKENPLIENSIVQSDDEQDLTQSLVGKVEEKESLILETCGKEAQSNSQTSKKEDNNVSVDLTDEIQIFEIAASGNICFNVHNVRMEKPSLPIGKTFGSDKKASSPVLTNAEPCQTFSAESPNLTTDITSNEQELYKDNYSPAQETDLLGGDVSLKGENTLCNAEMGHGDHQIKKVSNEATVDSCSKSNKNAITNEYEESDISSKNMNEIKAETIDTGTNNDEKIVAASYLTNFELLSPNDLLSRPNDLLSSHNDDEEMFGEEEKYVNNIVKDSVKPNMAEEIENSQYPTNIPSVVKENTVEDKNTDHFVCESTNQRTDDKEVTLLAAERENCVALNENNVKNNEIENGEIQALVYETSTDAIPAALENEPVFESVSEKVKKRKRNASGRQFNEFVHENKNIGNVVNATVVKKTVSKNKKTENDNSRIIDATKKSNMASAVPNSVKATRPDRLLSKITTKKYSANNKPIKDNVKPKASEPAQETTKIGRFSKVKKTKSTSPKFKKKKPTSPVKSDRPFEVVLSPGERVKMNKRQCRKEFMNVGLTYMNKIERMSCKGFTKNAETITSEADDKMVKDTSQESHPLSNVNETIEATNNSTKMNIREKTELQSAHDTDNSSEKADAISDVKRIQKSKSKSKLPRKISKESLAIGAKLAGSSLNLSVSMNETDIKRKRGRPKMNESSKESTCIPSKIPKFGSKDTDSLSLSEAVSAKRQYKAKIQKGT